MDVCRKQDGTEVAEEFQAFCNNTQQVEAHCIHGGRYCQVDDPDGSPTGGSGGREALVEMLRCKCVQQVAQENQEAQFFFSYMQVCIIPFLQSSTRSRSWQGAALLLSCFHQHGYMVTDCHVS